MDTFFLFFSEAIQRGLFTTKYLSVNFLLCFFIFYEITRVYIYKTAHDRLLVSGIDPGRDNGTTCSAGD